MKLAFIGCGNMGEAFLKNCLEYKLFKNSEIFVLEKSTNRKNYLENIYKIKVFDKFEDLQEICDIFFLAIKPQGLADFKSFEMSNKIIISILAGTKISRISEKFKNAKIVRTMPNLGQFVNQGMTGINFSETENTEFLENNNKLSSKAENLLNSDEKNIVKNIFKAGGKIVEVQQEADLDKITAISGSGPAYYFLFTEFLKKAAENIGLDQKNAEILAKQTLIGAAEILKNNPQDSAKIWRERVTSKGGTTEQAILKFQENNLEEIIQKSVNACEKKAIELGE